MTKPNEIIQASPGDACGPKNPALKRSHHKRKDIPSGTLETGPVCRGVTSGAPETESTRRGVPSGAPENADGLKSPSLRKDGQPAQAFAIVPDPTDAAGWQLPHHTVHVLRDGEDSVDWTLLEKATLLLSMAGDEGRRICADPAVIIDAALHVAGHYRAAGKPVPVALCVLI